MRAPFALASAAAVFASTLCASSARADTMDPAIERLTLPTVITDPSNPAKQLSLPCTDGHGRFVGNPTVGGKVLSKVVVQCQPDNVAFAQLINQYGAAIAPTAMHSARTTGFGGFHLSLEGAVTTIDKDAAYWHHGTQGTQDPNTKSFSTENTQPAGALQVYSLKIRKGFPFGFEISGQVGYMPSTSIVTGGADIRLSVLEGFRKGAPGILPDIAAGGGVRTISGTPEFNLTVASFDVQVSKQLPIADSSILTPYVGYQQLWIFGDSGLINSTPNTDPLGYCGYKGPNVPGSADPNKQKANGGKPLYDGQPVCATDANGKQIGSPLAFNNVSVFDNVRVTRKRFILGLNYRYEVVFVGFQWMSDIGNPEDAGGRDNASKLKGAAKQSTFVFELGALF